MRRDPLELRRALMRIAAQQAGHFSAAQALEVGYSYQVQRYHVQRGDWLRVDRGIFRLPDVTNREFCDPGYLRYFFTTPQGEQHLGKLHLVRRAGTERSIYEPSRRLSLGCRR